MHAEGYVGMLAVTSGILLSEMDTSVMSGITDPAWVGFLQKFIYQFGFFCVLACTTLCIAAAVIAVHTRTIVQTIPETILIGIGLALLPISELIGEGVLSYRLMDTPQYGAATPSHLAASRFWANAVPMIVYLIGMPVWIYLIYQDALLSQRRGLLAAEGDQDITWQATDVVGPASQPFRWRGAPPLGHRASGPYMPVPNPANGDRPHTGLHVR